MIKGKNLQCELQRQEWEGEGRDTNSLTPLNCTNTNIIITVVTIIIAQTHYPIKAKATILVAFRQGSSSHYSTTTSTTRRMLS